MFPAANLQQLLGHPGLWPRACEVKFSTDLRRRLSAAASPPLGIPDQLLQLRLAPFVFWH